MIHYLFTKKIGVLKGWSFPHFSYLGIKINIQKMIFLFLFLGNFSIGAKTYSYHCTSEFIKQLSHCLYTICQKKYYCNRLSIHNILHFKGAVCHFLPVSGTKMESQ